MSSKLKVRDRYLESITNNKECIGFHKLSQYKMRLKSSCLFFFSSSLPLLDIDILEYTPLSFISSFPSNCHRMKSFKEIQQAW